jgi:predicted signal transduction protein with EAL and GGDEF domain
VETVEAEFFPQFLEKMLDGVAYCQMLFENGNPIDFRYLYTNPAFHAQTRIGPVAGKLVSEIIPGIRASDPVLFERYGRVASTGKSESFEIYIEGLGDWFLVHAFCPKPGYLVAIFNVITKSKEAELRIDHLANHDLLTDLPNRALFYDRLSNAMARARRNSESLYFFLLDLDDFKPINDLYGHKAGDIVLQNVAERLLCCVC